MPTVKSEAARGPLRTATQRNQVISDSLNYFEEQQEDQARSTQLIEIQPVAVPPLKQDTSPAPKIIKKRLNQPIAKISQLPQRLRPAIPKTKIIEQELDDFDFSLNLGAGLRQDQFEWSIAGDTSGQNPNILSELTYKDILIYQVGTEANLLWADRFLLEGSVDYGWVQKGNNQDSDYNSDNRGGEFSRSTAKIVGDNTLDASFGGGYQLRIPVPEDWEDFLTDDLKVAVLGGYSRHELNIRITDGFQDISLSGSFEGLDETYDTVWKGPWLGLQLNGTRKSFNGFTRLEYHWARFKAGANWNLRDDFQHPTSFIDTADAHGLVLTFGGDLAFNDDLSFGLKVKVQNWKTDAGLDRTFFSDGTTADTQFNPAKWSSYGGMLTGTYRFSLGSAQPGREDQQKQEDRELSRL